MSLILIIILLVLLFGGIGSLPYYGHSANWGYGPSGLIGLLLVVVVVMLLLGRL